MLCIGYNTGSVPFHPMLAPGHLVRMQCSRGGTSSASSGAAHGVVVSTDSRTASCSGASDRYSAYLQDIAL